MTDFCQTRRGRETNIAGAKDRDLHEISLENIWRSLCRTACSLQLHGFAEPTRGVRFQKTPYLSNNTNLLFLGEGRKHGQRNRSSDNSLGSGKVTGRVVQRAV